MSFNESDRTIRRLLKKHKTNEAAAKIMEQYLHKIVHDLRYKFGSCVDPDQYCESFHHAVLQFIKRWRQVKKPAGNFLWVVAKHRCIDFLRQNQRRKDELGSLVDGDIDSVAVAKWKQAEWSSDDEAEEDPRFTAVRKTVASWPDSKMKDILME